MRVFCASLATETNTFSPLRTDMSDFLESFYAPPGEHPETPTLCSAVFPALRRRASAGEIELIEGTATWAEPGGLLNAATWRHLRDEVLDQLRAAAPVDAVVLGLHGAMIADGCTDPEGELIAAAREIAGPGARIGVTFDPHSHLSARRVENADIITVFKEFPHTDFVETGEACVELTLRAARGEIAPAISVFDVRMIDVLPTSRAPMRGFVDKMSALEGQGTILSVSAIHGFMAGDSPDLGAKIIVITDADPARGAAVARELGQELFSFRGRTKPEFLSARAALLQASAAPRHPVVIADVWDNPGGGVAGDSTIILQEALSLGIANIAFGTIWDPMAVRLCHAAGEGATLRLRFGAKTSDSAGAPIDADVTVLRVQKNAVQSFGASVVPLGDCAVIEARGIQIVLNSNRAQSFSPDLFTNLGIDVSAKQILVVKSTNHFHGAFAPIAADIIYAAVDGPYPNDPRNNAYTRLTRKLWPIVDNPFEEEAVR
ncbi:M81 family metallopeptidase [Defluviimonas sp. WL0075]|uniref:Microcystinase C n=1 Tax=Albidovulum sediminicola TaxID=2984331 RepID=A0ABT2Z209_9RHOB|nr:M81 family metallopeptidase [Defluviimonas sp. WL0075]MCV2865128.1 M81 family metallopeptidase [Defluviimonas sp. WL0075]